MLRVMKAPTTARVEICTIIKKTRAIVIPIAVLTLFGDVF
jgi:hypothetical protein